jgi:hypothetical protein
MHTMLLYIARTPTLLTSRLPRAVALVLTVHEEEEPCTLPSSRNSRGKLCIESLDTLLLPSFELSMSF